MITLTGIVTKGLRGATTSFQKQLAFFDLPGIKALQNGSINLNIAPWTFSIKKFDYLFPHIEWEPDRIEDFGFINVSNITYRGLSYDQPGYIYIPHGNPHFSDPSLLEIICIPIPKIYYGSLIQITIPDDRLTLS